MPLTLSILRAPHAVTPERRHLQGATFSLGRSPDNDWVLADTDRHLSKRHCSIVHRDGGWELTDLSTNGTWLNQDDAPIGQRGVRDLRDGDRLSLGEYEFAVHINNDAKPAPPRISPGIDQPHEMDPFANGPPVTDRFASLVQPDHTPSVEDAFRPPRPVVLLDDDWDIASCSESGELARMVPPAIVADPAPLSSPAIEAEGDLMRAFLRGAGLPDASPTDPAATMEALGGTFRALVAGLRATLIARAAIKDEFRISQTVIRTSGNNPLKFSASDDDAMISLLGGGRRTGLAAAVAVEEALRDIRMHELATMAAMQSAARAQLRDFAPASLRAAAGQGGLLPQQRKARAWDAFEALHARTTQAMAGDSDSTFGRAFARAYEQAQRESSP